MKLSKTLGWTVVVAVLLAPGAAWAQGIAVEPAEVSYDFGDAVLGSSATVIFTISSTEPTPLIVYSVSIVDDSGGAFAISSAAPPPQVTVYTDGDPLLVEVTFTPTALGMHSASIRIQSDAGPPRNDLYVALQGAGTTEEPTGGEAMTDLLEFFDTSVDDMTIVGDGPGSSAGGRLGAFGNMLDSADDLIAAGDIEAACDQLDSAYRHADGMDRPPDFITGPSAATVAEMILDVMDAIGCL